LEGSQDKGKRNNEHLCCACMMKKEFVASEAKKM